jgi:hypothetical protein
MTTMPATDFIEYAEDRILAWFDGIDHRSVPSQDLRQLLEGLGCTGLEPKTVAEALRIDAEWPTGEFEDGLSNVLELIDQALDEEAILLRSPLTKVALIRTSNQFGVLTGVRLLVETGRNVTLASGEPMWTSDFTSGAGGRDAALAALRVLATTVDRMVRNYRAAEGH